MRSIVRIYSVRGFGLTGKSCVQPAKPSENCQLFHAAVAYSSSSANICMLYKVPLREVSPYLPGVTQVEWD